MSTSTMADPASAARYAPAGAENRNSGRVIATNGHNTMRGNGWSATSPTSRKAPRMLDGGAARYARIIAAATRAIAADSTATGSHATRRLLALADRSRDRASDTPVK